jgi:hypothetical protein
MCLEASTVVRAVAADFFFDCGDVEIPANESTNKCYESVTKCKYKGTGDKSKLGSERIKAASLWGILNTIEIRSIPYPF